MHKQISEEENIDRLLAHFQRQGLYPLIQEWRQRIEKKEARVVHRRPQNIDTEQALQDFRQALLLDIEHSESAKALLRKLNRPVQPKFTAVEAWRALAHPPKNPSPELQVYLDHHAKIEIEKRKWDVRVTDEQWQLWDQLIESGQWNEYHQQLSSLFEAHLDAHPKLDEELILRFTVRKTHSQRTIHEEEVAPFHSSGLFWLAANIAFKRLGLDERIEQCVLAWLEEHWKKSDIPIDEKGFVFGTSYAQVRKRLFVRGAHTVRRLDHFLAKCVKNLMLRSTGYDPNGKRKMEKVGHPKYPDCDLLLNIGDMVDTVRDLSPEGFPDQAATVNSFLRSLPERDRNILIFSMANPDATDKETANAFRTSTKTIQRARILAAKHWQKLA